MSLHVDPAAFERAEGAERRAMVRHLRECGPCRAGAAAHDPTILFALLAESPIPDRLFDDVSRGVRRSAGRDRGSVGAVVLGVSSIRRGAAAAVAVLALASGYVTLRERPAPAAVAVEGPGATPETRRAPRRADVDVQSGQAVSQVVDFTVGETQVVMVYNRDLQL